MEQWAISSEDLRRLQIFGCTETEGQQHAGSLRGLSLPELENMAISLLKPSRVNHVLGCRDTAVELAEVWHADPIDAARAALLHDVTKALNSELQLALCHTYGVTPENFFVQNPKTLHALTGSLVADRIFGENEAVVNAIYSHTTGKANMNTLEKIIYVADYMEPNRDFPGVEQLRKLAYTDLDKALRLGLEMTLKMLNEQGKQVSQASADALAWLIENEK